MIPPHNPFNESQTRLYSNLLSSIENETRQTALEESETDDAKRDRQKRDEIIEKDRARRAKLRSERRAAAREKKRHEDETRVERRRAYVKELARRKKWAESVRLAAAMAARPLPFFDVARGGGGGGGSRAMTTTTTDGRRQRLVGVSYVGDRCRVTEGWMAHGKGMYVLSSGDILYNGGWNEGRMNGYGVYRFDEDGSTWNGRFTFDALDGIGSLRRQVPPSSRNGGEGGTRRQAQEREVDVIYRRNRRVCSVEELRPGVYIRFIEGSSCGGGGIVLGDGTQRGHYDVKSDDGVVRRNVDLANRGFELCDASFARVVPIESVCRDERDNPPTVVTQSDDRVVRRYEMDNIFIEESEHADDEKDLALRKKKETEMKQYGILLNELKDERARSIVRAEVKEFREAKRLAEERHAREALMFEEKLRRMRREREQKIKMEEIKIKKSREDAMRLQCHVT